MNKLSVRELVLFRRAAEDAIHACNRHYGPFIDVVAHPLNMLKLIDMAELSNQQQSKMHDQQKRINAAEKLIQQWRDAETYSDDCANELEQALKGDAS
ncbi:hypothetical protein [Acinetobacter higginsii]|uniref:hypothetical protein n=1 Tax=Acinetobacter higginsii TaxID=70347 RepID=UPI001F61C61B|nr:hypothetical protein [Acinetobacter higginsii]MCI3877725.1 hypothetical protein [Acinetobacter higginsii]